jgi:mono/diheme cytochrome c family protein
MIERLPMMLRTLGAAMAVLAVCGVPAIAAEAEMGRPVVATLPVPPGATKEQVLLGDRIFHGEAAGGKCSVCHGADAKGTALALDLTSGMWVWGDGSQRMIKTTIVHNMTIAPGMDGALTPPDVDAVVAYVWAISHRKD